MLELCYGNHRIQLESSRDAVVGNGAHHAIHISSFASTLRNHEAGRH